MAAAPSTRLAPSPVTSVACYLRVSTQHQNEANQIPDVERKIAERYPGAQVRWYRERKSAAKKRPVFDELIRDAKAARFQAVVIWSLDRFGRSMRRNIDDILTLNTAGVCVVSCRESWLDTESPTRDLLLAIISWVAEYERRRLTERISAGLQRVKEKGGATSMAVFGLVNVRDDKADVTRRAVDKKARPTLVRMAVLFLLLGQVVGGDGGGAAAGLSPGFAAVDG